MPNETCDKQIAGVGPCHLPAGHAGECDHQDEHRNMEDAHQQEAETLDDFMHNDDKKA
jgi:hypothetical protein